MCGRFGVDENLQKMLKRQLKVNFIFTKNRDIRPTDSVATLVSQNGKLSQLNCSWGIKPAWSKQLLINAKSETVSEKPTFKQSFQNNRCVVPLTCWYEWKNEGKAKKTKYQFNSSDKNILYMAGIYFPSEDNPQLVTLTTSPTEDYLNYHHRMPLLLSESDIEAWLNSTEYAYQLSQRNLSSDNKLTVSHLTD